MNKNYMRIILIEIRSYVRLLTCQITQGGATGSRLKPLDMENPGVDHSEHKSVIVDNAVE